MKNKQRESKFKLGQVVMTPVGFRGIIISIEGKGNIKYIVSVDGNFGNHKISEKKLLKLNPISSKPKERENEVINDPFRKAHKTLGKALEKLRSHMVNEKINGFPMLNPNNLNSALHMVEINKKVTESDKTPFCHGDLVEVKNSGVRLYVNGAHFIGGLYDIGIDWRIDCDVVIKDIHHDSLILIKRNND